MNPNNLKVWWTIVAGGRDFSDYSLLESTLNSFFGTKSPEELVIISGRASGADTLGERYAYSKGLTVKPMPAEWDRYGNKAGPIRNMQMLEYATHVVCFWDGASRGTKHMIDSTLRAPFRRSLLVIPYQKVSYPRPKPPTVVGI